MNNIKDLTNHTFHSWTVLSFSHFGSSRKQHWNCRCQCGALKTVESYNLTSGRSQSCRKCSAAKVGEFHIRTHGLSNTKEYIAWQAMKTRCYNEKHEKTFKYHGALGVKVHPDWKDDFLAFLQHIGPAPTKLHTVDRIDPFGDYEPGNVRWATQAEQMANTRRSKKILQNTR